MSMPIVRIRFLGSALLAGALCLAGFGGPAAAATIHTTQTPVGGAGPPATDANDGVPYELGMQFQSSVDGIITAIRYWRADSEACVDNSHTGNIWSATGTLLASVSFVGETAGGGWQEQLLATPLAITANTTYTVSVNTLGYYVYTYQGLKDPIVNGSLSSIAGSSLGTCTGPADANGVYGSPGNFPTSSFNCANYFRDVQFTAGVVPVPAAAWLFISGAGVLGLARRRLMFSGISGTSALCGATVTDDVQFL